MAGFEDECNVEVGELSRSVMEISNALVDLGMLPIQDIPQLLITAEEVLVASRGYADPPGVWSVESRCNWVARDGGLHCVANRCDMGRLTRESLSCMQQLRERGHIISAWTEVTTHGCDGVL
jgi:hypothetical protein